MLDIEGNRIAEYDYAGGSSTPIREYIWMDGASVAVVEGGVVYYVRVDHIGRPVFATDGSGAKVWEATYLPFGEVLATSGNPIALRFPGQWFQAESGLHQNWMRDYDPTTGRYLQADPLGLVDGASVYGYVGQNPGRYVDPRGELGVPGAVAGGIVGGIAGGIAGYGTTGCWTGAAIGAFVGGVSGASIGAFSWQAPARVSAAIGGISSAAGQIAANYAAEFDCGCKRPLPFLDLIGSKKFWGTTAGGALGSGVGARIGGGLATRISKRIFLDPAVRNPARVTGAAITSGIVDAIPGSIGAGVGEFGGGYPWN